MYKSQAKKLKAGDRVIWINAKERIEGTVVRKKYNTVWIKWDDQDAERTYFAEAMENVFTRAQLDAMAQEKRMAAAGDANDKLIAASPPRSPCPKCGRCWRRQSAFTAITSE